MYGFLFLHFLSSLPRIYGKAVLTDRPSVDRALSESSPEDTWQIWEIVLASGSAGVALLLLIYACLLRPKRAAAPVSAEVVRVNIGNGKKDSTKPASKKEDKKPPEKKPPIVDKSGAVRPTPQKPTQPPSTDKKAKQEKKADAPKPEVKRRASAPTKGGKRSAI